RRHAIREIGHARVGIAMVVGADRADDDADRALLRRDARPHEAAATIEAIAATVLSRFHLVVDEDDLALDRAVGGGSERVEAREIGDLALDALDTRGTAVAERGDRQLLRQEGTGQPRLFIAALPDRHLIGFL